MQAPSPNRNETLWARTSRTLLRRVRDWGDKQGWEQFYEIYGRMVGAMARRSGLSPEESQEVVQNTMLDVARRIREFEYDPAAGSFRAWLSVRARACIGERLRQAAVHQRYFCPQDGGDGQSDLERPDAAAEPAVLEEHLWSEALVNLAVDRLRLEISPREFQLFELSAIKGWSARRIHRALGASVTHVYFVRARAGLRLRRQLRRLKAELDTVPAHLPPPASVFCPQTEPETV